MRDASAHRGAEPQRAGTLLIVNPRRRWTSRETAALYNATVNRTLDADSAAADLRAHMRDRRMRLGAAERIEAAEGVALALERLPEFLVDRNVAGYWAVSGELPLHIAVARLRARGQNYCVPVLAGKQLRFAHLAPRAELRANRHGIPEPVCAQAHQLAPTQLDLVLVPLTAFDRTGGRLGMGGGYYDRSFAFLRGQPRPARPLLVGIGYSFQEVPALAARTHDVPMDFIATERELIDCRPAAEHDA